MRHPKERILAAPLFRRDGSIAMIYVSDEELIEMAKKDPIIECTFTGHVFMIKPEPIRSGAKMSLAGYDIVVPFTDEMRKNGLKVYCATDVYLKHISLDGKIYRTGLVNVDKPKKEPRMGPHP